MSAVYTSSYILNLTFNSHDVFAITDFCDSGYSRTCRSENNERFLSQFAGFTKCALNNVTAVLFSACPAR